MLQNLQTTSGSQRSSVKKTQQYITIHDNTRLHSIERTGKLMWERRQRGSMSVLSQYTSLMSDASRGGCHNAEKCCRTPCSKPGKIGGPFWVLLARKLSSCHTMLWEPSRKFSMLLKRLESLSCEPQAVQEQQGQQWLEELCSFIPQRSRKMRPSRSRWACSRPVISLSSKPQSTAKGFNGRLRCFRRLIVHLHVSRVWDANKM